MKPLIGLERISAEDGELTDGGPPWVFGMTLDYYRCAVECTVEQLAAFMGKTAQETYDSFRGKTLLVPPDEQIEKIADFLGVPPRKLLHAAKLQRRWKVIHLPPTPHRKALKAPFLAPFRKTKGQPQHE